MSKNAVQMIDYASDARDWGHRVAIAALVMLDKHIDLVPLQPAALSELDARAQTHVDLVLRTLRNRIAHGKEPTSPSAQVFLRDATVQEAAMVEKLLDRGR